ncbi:hypothetical protein [Enterobacteriaceae endosymbiont of Donacia simplex]|nr:hypothetical protein [Enterobacteriaceae endosymbiont of Donacia simplex]
MKHKEIINFNFNFKKIFLLSIYFILILISRNIIKKYLNQKITN